MNNVIKIKHGVSIDQEGNPIPPHGKLQDYELGYNDSDGLIYMGSNNGTMAIPLRSNESNLAKAAESSKRAEHADAATVATTATSATTANLAQSSQQLINTEGKGLDVGNKNNPIYFINGVPSACEAVEKASLAISANLLVNDNKEPLNYGSTSIPVYFKDGVPLSCETIAVSEKALILQGDITSEQNIGFHYDKNCLSFLRFNNYDKTVSAEPGINNGPIKDWLHIIRLSAAESAKFYTDIAIPFHDQGIWIKKVKAGITMDNKWVRLYDEFYHPLARTVLIEGQTLGKDEVLESDAFNGALNKYSFLIFYATGYNTTFLDTIVAPTAILHSNETTSFEFRFPSSRTKQFSITAKEDGGFTVIGGTHNSNGIAANSFGIIGVE